MSVIATDIDRQGAVRIFFDCRPADPDPEDEARIARAIEAAMTQADPKRLPRAA